jgi:transposase
MPYITEADRGQLQLFAMDDLVAKDSAARVIDAFVESLDLKALGFSDTGVSFEGRPAYRPQALLKLLLYGNGNRLRSSRLLQKACGVNIEVMWMLGGLTPDFRTISDFRKDNIKCLKKVFREFNARVSKLLPHGALSVDGSKFRACNSKDNNFTAAKLQDRIDWLNRHSDEYLRQLEELDALDDENEHGGRFSREELEEKILAASERLERYLSYQRQMEQSGQGQLSLIDPESKLMKGKDGMLVGFNVQAAVDAGSHLIEDFNVTTNCTDHGEIYPTLREIRENAGGVIDSIEDKGYFQADDMVACLENGIIPHVIPPDGSDTYELETSFEEAVCTPEEIAGTEPHDLAKCLRAGIKPDAYSGVIDSIEVVEKRCRVYDEPAEGPADRSDAEMLGRAAEGYFVRDPEKDLVYCPAGNKLFRKAIKTNGYIRYANKPACKRCPHRDRCFSPTHKQDWREIDFLKDDLEKLNRRWLKSDPSHDTPPKLPRRRTHFETKTIVRIIFRPIRQLMDKRKCTSEHPFGTIKRALNAEYYLLRGVEKTTGDTALFCFAHNLTRSLNLLGFRQLMAAVCQPFLPICAFEWPFFGIRFAF